MKSINDNKEPKQTRDNNRNKELQDIIRNQINCMINKKGVSSYSDLAEKSGIDSKKFYKLMENQFFYADDLYAIAKALGVSMDYLCTGKNTSEVNILRLDGLNNSDRELIRALFSRLENNW